MRLLVMRGDLQSHSGYSGAVRDYAAVMAPMVDKVVGVDIHFHPSRPFQTFPYPLVGEAEAEGMAREAVEGGGGGNGGEAVVVSVTTPDCYRRYAAAVNVGMTFWETDRLPLQGREESPWVAAANAMDALWLPATHTREVFVRAGVTAPMAVIPWPVEAPQGGVAGGLPEGTVYHLDRRPTLAAPVISVVRAHDAGMRRFRKVLQRAAPRLSARLLDFLRVGSDSIPDPRHKAVLCVAQDVPRKGLLLFLSEWVEFKRRPEAEGWSLILKTYPIDPATPAFDFVIKFWEHVQGVKKQLGVRQAGVYLWTGNLAPWNFDRLFENVYACAIPSMGEGFCGPAAAAIAAGKPLVAPRHTAMADYIPAAHPYAFASAAAVVNFVGDPLRVYDPVSSWYVPEAGAIAGALSRLATDGEAARERAGEEARVCLEAWCGKTRVRGLLRAELDRLLGDGVGAGAQRVGNELPMHTD